MKHLFGSFFFSYLLVALNVAALVYLITLYLNTRPWFHP